MGKTKDQEFKNEIINVNQKNNNANIKSTVHEGNFVKTPFPRQYEYRVSGVDICFEEAWQLLASQPIEGKVVTLSVQRLTKFNYIN